MHATPHAMTPSEDDRAWARSGAMSLTGHAGGAPLCPPTRAATLVDELAAPFGLDSGLLAERAALTGWERDGRVTLGGAGRLLRARDGWVALSLPRPEDVELIPALLGLESPAADEPWPVVESAIASRPGAAVVERARLLGLAAAVVGGARAHPSPWWWPHAKGAERDLDGAVVVDLSALWAGPLCGALLLRAGARVIKVESSPRPDGARRGNSDFYDLLNVGKESVALDLTTTAGRADLGLLVARADVVITAARSRAIAGLGLDPGAMTGRTQAWVAITARGRDDDSVGFGDDIAAGAGLVAWDEAGEPCFAGDAIADPLCGVVAAAAVLRGAAGVVDISMEQVASLVVAEPGARAIAAQRCQHGGVSVEQWCLGDEPVSRPRLRRAAGSAAPLGADTSHVLARVAR